MGYLGTLIWSQGTKIFFYPNFPYIDDNFSFYTFFIIPNFFEKITQPSSEIKFSLCHDPIASNQISEICQWTNEICFLEGKSNLVADWLSRPQEVPLGTAYQLPKREEVSAIEGVKLEVIDSGHLAAEQ